MSKIALSSILRSPRIIERIVIAFPIIGLLLFYSFALRARTALGHWPSYDNPDPKTLGFGLHYWTALLGLAFGLASIFPWILVALSRKKTEKSYSFVSHAVVAILVYALMVCILMVDVGHFIDWFID